MSQTAWKTVHLASEMGKEIALGMKLLCGAKYISDSDAVNSLWLNKLPAYHSRNLGLVADNDTSCAWVAHKWPRNNSYCQRRLKSLSTHYRRSTDSNVQVVHKSSRDNIFALHRKNPESAPTSCNSTGTQEAQGQCSRRVRYKWTVTHQRGE